MKLKYCVVIFLMFILSAGIQLNAQLTNNNCESFGTIKAKAEKNDVQAQYKLGLMYFYGVGIPENLVESKKWLDKAITQKFAPARFNYGFWFSASIPKDCLDEAREWFLKAANQGNGDAEDNLCTMYANGFGVIKDSAEASKWEKKAAEDGSAAAQFSLGLRNEIGFDGAQDYAEALKWYRKAAEQGMAAAQDNLGRCYDQGQGVSPDYNEAVKWYRKAAVQGLAQAQYNLGLRYFQGRGLTQNNLEAYFWSNLAAAQGFKQAEHLRDAASSNLTREELSEGQRRAAAFVPQMDAAGSNSVNSSPENPSITGTGFFITDDGYLITSAHVVDGAKDIVLETGSGIVEAKLIKFDHVNDLALLKASEKGLSVLYPGQKDFIDPKQAKVKFIPVPLTSSRGVKLGSMVATVGFPNIGLQGCAPKLAKGEIASLSGAGDDPRYFQISVPVQPGNSGGALVDERGNVIGIVSAKLDASAALAASGALPENVNYAVKSSLLLSFLESVPEVDAKLKSPVTADRKFEEVVRSAQDAAVLVLVY